MRWQRSRSAATPERTCSRSALVVVDEAEGIGQTVHVREQVPMIEAGPP
jgi:hypothetical protein